MVNISAAYLTQKGGHRYRQRLDPHAGAEIEWGELTGDRQFCPTFAVAVMHPALVSKPRVSKAQVRSMQIKQAALRVVCGIEDRSLRQLAADIGCCHQAIDKAITTICKAIGMPRYLRHEAKARE